MKKFLKKNWFRIVNVVLIIVLAIVGWMKYGKKIMDMLASGTDLEQLESERRSNQGRVDSSIDRIDKVTGRAEDLEREIRDRSDRVQETGNRVSERGDQLDGTVRAVSELSERIEDRIKRNKDIIRRLHEGS